MRSKDNPLATKLWEAMGLQPGLATWFAVWQLSRSTPKPEPKK